MESIPEETFKLIFEYLRDDLNCLLSCLVVNKQWARVTVETMWRNPWRYIKNTKGEDSKKAEVKLISILISFLPEDSRAILREHGIIIPSPLQSPLYDYAGLSRYLTHYDVNRMTELILTLPEYKGSVETTTLTCQSESYTSYLIKQELYRMYVDQCRALKLLEFRDADIPLPFFREAERCFSNLCELHCDTTLLSGTYYRMAQICQNLERLVIVDCHYDNDGLATLIEVQNNLGYLKIITKGSDEHGNSRHNRYIRIANAISTQAHSLHHFDIGGSFVKAIPPVTIATFENLRTLHIRFEGKYEDILKYSSFSQLQVLKCYHVPNPMDVLTHFIERTGGLLRKISFKINSVGDFTMIPQYNKKIAESCPNIRSLTTWFRTDSVADFRQVLISCPNLEHLTIGNYENED
ncbi:15497_t:CDS:1, partial [Acaulospora morrowiae]